VRQRPASNKNPGGRPRQIDDGRLFNRRDYLIQMLSNAWGDVGWELRCSSTIENVRKALGCLQAFDHKQLFRPLLSHTVIETSAVEIRSTKRSLGDLVKQMYEIAPTIEAPNKPFQNSGHAISQNISSPQLGVLLKEHARNLAVFRKGAREMRRIQVERKEKEIRLASQQAYFAQHELLSFIQYRKYAHNPRNLAQAMAGLPDIGCWQSFQRCEKQPSALWPTIPDEIPLLSYHVFRIISECWDSRNSVSDKTFLDVLRDRIRAIPATDYVRSHLTQSWRYLRQAAEQADLTQLVPDAVPYRVFGTFMRAIAQSGSPEESILAAREQRDIEDKLKL
jgi:hypothetical protein